MYSRQFPEFLSEGKMTCKGVLNKQGVLICCWALIVLSGMYTEAFLFPSTSFKRNKNNTVGKTIHQQIIPSIMTLSGDKLTMRHKKSFFMTQSPSSSPLPPDSRESELNPKNKKSVQMQSLAEQEQATLERVNRENDFLKRQIQELADENDRLEQRLRTSSLVLENFEGENRREYDASGSPILRWFQDDNEVLQINSNQSLNTNASNEIVCETDILGNEVCPVEPGISFSDALRDRAYWLVGLLALQSCSGFILAKNEILLQRHPVIIYFLTMLIGAGGNAGNQASVRVIRGLALGTLNEDTQQQFLTREFKMAFALSGVLSVAGFLRAIIFRTPFAETIAITSALSVIVLFSICLGAVLPILLKKLGVDPAHSSTSIQVIMDILGVILTVFVSTIILDSPIGQSIISKLSVF